jgi:hypothetical protein
MLLKNTTIYTWKNQRDLCQHRQRVSTDAACPEKDFIAIPQITVGVSIDVACAAMQRGSIGRNASQKRE